MPAVPSKIRSPARALLALLFSLFLLFPITADDAADQQAALDRLFAQLHDATDAPSANAISNQIWAIWTTPADPSLASRMRDVMEARAMLDLQTGIDLLDAIIVDYPEYAEGWNQRATLYYMLGDYEASIADCAKVLELEPRHYGALSGRALMYLQMGKRSLALRDMKAALELHPFLAEKQLFPELAQEITRT
ncbi:MAG TPA: tetratricopeptide repeat protein [Devosia sp.]